MAPARRKRRRTHYRNRVTGPKDAEESTKGHCVAEATTSPSTTTCPPVEIEEDNGGDDFSASGCSTPRAERYRIPKLLSCPPAPKKRRIALRCSPRKPISFFTPPELEVFFFFALRDISV
ncbi:hypothetical protein H6P81_009373 [Aristolochia fimbriata]|uniref:Cyclin-dependent protein kinase inhibitor SMR9 n=1 Tax=Aristolochia fimbriata TaxID=158543 RepID=A0AAV7EKR9_ARIFI|nr:hypothetical protein H6P81_009373 [Aristolochia fimbriata]